LVDLAQRIAAEVEAQKNPFFRLVRIIAASNLSMSGRPT
jgi:hypothetical protein